ncbi:MAG TPA: sugar phosphate nucleotidyltransferase [Rhodothermales bacterium]
MIAIMLCAGYGTRLHPMTRSTPKGLLVVGGHRILDYQMPQLLALPDLSDIHLVTNGHYMAQFYVWASEWESEVEAKGVSLHLHNDGSLDEKDRLGSVGDLSFLLRHTGVEQQAVITAGDNIYRFPLRPIAEEFVSGSDNLILALRETSYQVRQRYPIVEFADGDRVANLREESDAPASEWVCPSLYFLQPDALRRVDSYLAEGGAPDSFACYLDHIMQHEPVRAIRKEEARVWLDVETRYMFNKANDILASEPLMVE